MLVKTAMSGSVSVPCSKFEFDKRCEVEEAIEGRFASQCCFHLREMNLLSTRLSQLDLPALGLSTQEERRELTFPTNAQGLPACTASLPATDLSLPCLVQSWLRCTVQMEPKWVSVTKTYWALPVAESWLSAEDTAQTQKGTTPRSDFRKREEFWVEPRT